MAHKASEIKKLATIKSHQRSEEDWEGIYDAQSLAKAELIKDDETRYRRAILWAQVLASKEQEEFEAMKKVSSQNA